MSTHDDDSADPAGTAHDSGRSAATGTGWAEDASASSLSARLAHLDSLAAGGDADDDELDAFVPFDELDDDELEDDEYDDTPHDTPDAAAPVLAALARDGGRAASSGLTVATVPATEEVLPTSVPGMRAARRRARRSVRRRVSLPLVVLLVVTLLAGAFTASLWLDVRERTQAEEARRTGLEASRDAARLLFSYDYRTLDKDFATGRALTTGSFRTDYEKTTTKVVADVAKRYKAVVKANVINAGVVSASPSTVVTVVYVNQVTSSTQVKGEKVDLSRVRMTLVRSGDVWLVTKVDAL